MSGALIADAPQFTPPLLHAQTTNNEPWLQMPQATVHSSDVADAWLAWHSMQRSMMWFRQIAQLSTTMSHAHNATAFHFFTTKPEVKW